MANQPAYSIVDVMDQHRATTNLLIDGYKKMVDDLMNDVENIRSKRAKLFVDYMAQRAVSESLRGEIHDLKLRLIRAGVRDV